VGREQTPAQRKARFVLCVVAALGSGGVAAWALSAAHAIAAVAFAIAAVAWGVAAVTRRRDPETANDGPLAHTRRARGGAVRVDAIDRVVEPGETPRQWTIAADTSRGAVRRGALLLSDRALYCTFEAGPNVDRRTTRIPIPAITDISRRPPQRLGVRFRTPSGNTTSLVVDLPPRDDADELVGALVEARRRITVS
jgi:hypothetical protein